MKDYEKLEILAGWIESTKEPETLTKDSGVLTRLDHVLATNDGKRMVADDLRRMAKVMKHLEGD